MTRRILMVSLGGHVNAEPDVAQPDTGDEAVYVLELSKALARIGYEVDILARQFAQQPAEEPVDEGVRILRLPCGPDSFLRGSDLLHAVPEFVKRAQANEKLHKRGYEMVNSHGWESGGPGVSLAMSWGLPHVHTPHTLGFLVRQHRAVEQTDEEIEVEFDERIRRERAIYCQAGLLIAMTAGQTRCLRDSEAYRIDEENIVQIPPGFDDTVFNRPLEGERIVLKQSFGWCAPTVLAAGQLTSGHGYDLLIRAFPAVIRRIPDAQLVLAIGSDQPSPEEQRRLTQLKLLAGELGVGSRVRITSCQPQRKIADYCKSADVFVLSSRHEPGGMAAVEAMACGTPTVVTTQCGLCEEFKWGQDCIYCDPLDLEALALAICCPLQHAQVRQQLSRHGAAVARARYTWDQVASQLIDRCEEAGMIGWLHRPFLADARESA